MPSRGVIFIHGQHVLQRAIARGSWACKAHCHSHGDLTKLAKSATRAQFLGVVPLHLRSYALRLCVR